MESFEDKAARLEVEAELAALRSSDRDDNIRVAVRVRPFNMRERDSRCSLIIKMSGPATTLLHPDSGTRAGSAAVLRWADG